MNYDLEFDDSNYSVETISFEGKELTYRAYENIIYVKNPVDINYQHLSIFVPEVYYSGESIDGYDLKSAPIFLPNTIGGYMPGRPEKPGKDFMDRTNASFYALLNGYVVVSPGARGRGLTDEGGRYIGIAPACIVDLKAAVRYLRHNSNRIPGNVEKIISNGTSAGGALSSLLGVTGNHPDYEKYLEKIGAAKERDDIFAASCYCPITNLDHADMAYEWEFNGRNEYHRMKFEKIEGTSRPKMTPIDGEMTDLEKQLSEKLKVIFPDYLNSLALKDIDGGPLVLDSDGNGSFKNYVTTYVIASAQKELEKGTDLSDLNWLKVKDGIVICVDFEKYVDFRTRMKETPAFDSVSMGTPENELFGSEEIMYRHFTEFSREHSLVNGEIAEELQIKLMNPMNYIGDDTCICAKNFRIRHGAADRDT
ncbi:MAG: subtype B tannase, partial [Mobilitalea sp.]